MRLFIASANQGKIKEIQAILADESLELLSVRDDTKLAELGIALDPDFDVEETGKTFSDNAWLKAEAYSKLTGLATIADDSGLEVKALDGFPSVHSNRWFAGTPHERNLALLDLLKDKADRRARFVSVICFFDPTSGEKQFFEGQITGEIALEPRGDKLEGFGYDPLFIPEGYEQTFAEIGVKVKNTISHRRAALLKLSQYVLQGTRLAQRG